MVAKCWPEDIRTAALRRSGDIHKLPALAAAAFLAAPGGASGAPGADKRSGASEDLRLALDRMMDTTKATPPGQEKRPDDPGQGDDNASLRGITEVYR